MKKFVTFTLMLLLVAIGFFYLGYQPQPDDIDITGALFGYNIQTSQYTLYAILIIIFVIITAILKFFIGIKNIYFGILSFITGRSKDKATENLLNAYAHIVGHKPRTARNYLRKAEKYYKDSHHIALIRLMIEQAYDTERPMSDALAKLENHKILKPVGAYIESLFSVNHKDDKRMIALLKEAGNYAESSDIFYEYLTILVRNKEYNDAEIATKSARAILSDDDYKFHLSSICLLKSDQFYEEKNPEQMLSFGLESLKYFKNPIALQHVIQAYKTLQRDNKAVRLLHDYFLDIPSMSQVCLFIELKAEETPEETAKRIAALPRTHENSDSFLALQAYHFAVARDFISLNTALSNAHNVGESLWVKAAQLCVAVEKDAQIFTETLKLFKDALYAEARQEILDIYNVKHGDIYHNIVFQPRFIPEITKKEVIAKLSLFKEMLKSVPIIQKKNIIHPNEAIENPNLYHLEANIYKSPTKD